MNNDKYPTGFEKLAKVTNDGKYSYLVIGSHVLRAVEIDEENDNIEMAKRINATHWNLLVNELVRMTDRALGE